MLQKLLTVLFTSQYTILIVSEVSVTLYRKQAVSLYTYIIDDSLDILVLYKFI